MHIVAVAAFVTNAQGQVLMLKSPRYKDWEFPGGQVEESETIPHAVEREVLEETGLEVELSDLIKTYYFTDDPRGNGISFVYKATKVSGTMQINSEATNAQYFAPDEIPVYLTLGGHDTMIADWCANVKQKVTSS